ncbi:hypothetical protein P43SY_004876 [Pythium insidiosum]|uniref:Major facilitator superfamily (MFS) profile domain-containing protein n=1 Tax=Pythium insidiosum TaxID=114742 RepID=A0AAD5M1B7_PYTIN|nr:hypothetical protein P43SY_004876 [Pythium insidiosum]
MPPAPTPQVDCSPAPGDVPAFQDPADDLDLSAPLLDTSAPEPNSEDIPFTCFHRRPPSGHVSSTMPSIPQLGKQGVIGLLCVINLFNYIDRGIIPGTPEKFQHFITKTLHVEVTKQSFYLGLLASGFIASYSICSMVFGHLAQRYRPFRMISFGMTIWVVAVICCGLAHAMDSYYFLMFGRVLSGVGEASFQCNATPFINTHAPKRNRALWMGVYLASITVGTAMGYIYGSMVASTSLTWAGAFYIEGAIMVFLIWACMYMVPDELDTVPCDYDTVSTDSSPTNLADELLPADERLSVVRPSAAAITKAKDAGLAVPESSFSAGWKELFTNPTFVLIILGHAAYTFSLAALSVFSPVILIGLGMYTKETEVSTAFGGLIVLTGTIGTPIGGLLLDRITKRDAVSQEVRTYVSVKIIFVLMTIATAVALLMMAFTNSRLAFLGIMAICFLFLCALTPAEAIAVMELFPKSRHAMAVAANTLVIHLFGDVPSPIILGYFKDQWAPRCGTVELDGKAQLNPECPLDRDGLKNVLLFPVLWLLWGVFLWGAAVVVLRRSQRKAQRAQQEANHIITPANL